MTDLPALFEKVRIRLQMGINNDWGTAWRDAFATLSELADRQHVEYICDCDPEAEPDLQCAALRKACRGEK